MFSDPVKNLKLFGLRENMIVTDLGAGSGFYSLPAARMAYQGKIYAVDIQKDFLISLRKKAEEEHLKNIECIWGDVEKIGGTNLKDGIADAALVSNVLFQIEDKENFIGEIKRILKPGGRVLLIDWSEGSPVLGASHKTVPKNEAIKMFEEGGFFVEKEIDAGEHHYGIILKKTDEKE